MNVFKIAWRSIQHRGLGSFLTILSMALGVMMVVAVLTIHGLVSQSFRSNNSFGYNIIVGARGGGLQLTLNSVYYLSKPVENIPYEYYLAFCGVEKRAKDLKKSIAYEAQQSIIESSATASIAMGGLGLGPVITEAIAADSFDHQQTSAIKINKPGIYKRYTHMAIPLCQGDYYVDPETGAAFRCVGTVPDFFTELVLDIDTEEKFKFAQGRCFVEESPESGFFECVVGATVARRCDIKLGDKLQATHGDPNSASAHIHEQDYTVVGIIESTGTPHDGVVFLNLEGFYLMEDHAKNVEDDSVLGTGDDDEEDEEAEQPVDEFFADDEPEGESGSTDDQGTDPATADSAAKEDIKDMPQTSELTAKEEFIRKQNATRIPLPVEQREVTSLLVRTSKNDPYDMLGMFLAPQINQGFLDRTLDWTPYRPEQAQTAAQAVNPVGQVTELFETFITPMQWLLLGLTAMICIVSALSILVGIYNSMNQRKGEIAVMRALGASRGKVMMIMLCESVMLALLGGILGWVGGHALNAALSSTIERKTGVTTGFFEFAPPTDLNLFFGGMLPQQLGSIGVSPELLLIPALILLAVLVGIYPALSAYRTDVSHSLGK